MKLTRLLRQMTASRLFLPALALMLVLSLNLFLSPQFFHLELKDGRLYGSLIDVLNRSAPCALLAMGMSLVIATGGIDLSVGAVIAISGAVCANLLNSSFDAVLFVVTVGLLCGLTAGAINGSLVSLFGLQPIVATLTLMVAGRGVAQLINGGQVVTFQSEMFSAIGLGSIVGVPAPVIIVVLVFFALQLVMRFSALGLLIEACGCNPKACYYAGVNVVAIKFLVYGLSGVCAALAGIIVTADIQGSDANNAGLWLELDAILAVILGGASLMGGRFSLVSTLISVLILQSMTTTLIISGIEPKYHLLIKSPIIVVILLLQSSIFRAQIGHLLPKSQGASNT